MIAAVQESGVGTTATAPLGIPLAAPKRTWSGNTRKTKFDPQQTFRRLGLTDVANSPDPPFGDVANLVACHHRKIVAKKYLPPYGRRA